MDEGPNAHATVAPPEYSYLDQASMAMAQVLQVVSDSKVIHYVPILFNKLKPPKDTRAKDQFVGGVILNSLKLGIQLGEFQPKSLTLFHLALLAHVVHVEYPLYALFMSQCFLVLQHSVLCSSSH
jgi:hypothetical protein